VHHAVLFLTTYYKLFTDSFNARKVVTYSNKNLDCHSLFVCMSQLFDLVCQRIICEVLKFAKHHDCNMCTGFSKSESACQKSASYNSLI
jgi:hypothetical protein